MAALNEANVERKFQAVSNTQDSIQSLSLWVIHHKAHHEKIVGIWLKVVKKSNTKHRLTLFYLCNDIVQTCKRKHAIVYKDAFKEILKEAVVHVRDAGIRGNIERIFKIWGERNVYDIKFIEELTDIINNSTSRSVISRLLAEFQPEQALEKITSYEKLETENELRKQAISLLRLDTSTIEAIRQLKDRDKGREYSQQFEDGCVKLEEYLAHSDLENKDRVSLIELLEQSELFYDAQYSEAKVVANAYKNFGTRVSNLKKKLDEFMKTLPSPMPTPEPDAPSPEQSPVYPINEDNTEAIDMEMSDSDNDAPAVVETHTGAGSGGSHGRRDSTITTKAYPKPIASVTEIHMKHKSRKRKSSEPVDEFKSIMHSRTKSSFMSSKSKKDSSPDKTWESMMAAFKSSSKSSRDEEEEEEEEPEVNPISVVSHSVGRVSSMEIYNDQDEGEGTPVIDELSNTPVMDEGPDENVSNPIEFLTQLINQTKNAGSTPGSNFLESLSALQPGNSAQYGNGEHSEAKAEAVSETASPNSWAAWKAAQNPPPPPPPPQPVPPVGQQPPYPTQPPPPVRQQPSYNPSPTPPPPPPLQQQPPYPSPTPMMVPPPFPPNMHGIQSPQHPPLQMPPQPVAPVSQPSGPPPPVPPPMMVQPPPPPMGMPMAPPPSMPSWQHPHPVGHVPPPPVQPPVITNNLSPPVSSGYNISQPPPPPPPQLQPSPLKSPPAQIMMNALMRKRANSSNLKEIAVLDDNQTSEGGIAPPSPNMSLMSGGRPVRPAFPPTSPMGGMQGPRPPVGPPSSSPSASHRTVTDDQQEFIEKLKRKSNAMSPTSAPATISLQKPETGKSQRALTEIKGNESDHGADTNKPQELEEGENTETTPSEASSKESGDASSEGTASNANQKADKSSETGKEPAQEQQQRPERPPQRIQSVASRVSRIETTPDTRRFETHNYDRREEYGDPYQRDPSRDHYERYGDRYGYDRQRDYYQRDSYGNRSAPKRAPSQQYDRHSYSGYPRY